MSPRKTQQRREKPFAFKKPAIPIRNPTPPEDLAAPSARQMSPEAHPTKQELRSDSPQADFYAMLLPPSPPASAMLSEDLEGDTLLTDSPDLTGDKTGGSSGDEWDANEETMVVDDGTYMEHHKKIDGEIERIRRDQQGRDLRDAGWSEDAVFLFQKLGMRGFEPLLPISWINDFETVPEDLFTEKLDKAFIKPIFGTDYSGMYTLDLGKDLTNSEQRKTLLTSSLISEASYATPGTHARSALRHFTSAKQSRRTLSGQ